MADVTTQTKLGFPYVSKNYHRNGNGNKSQWKTPVTVSMEVNIFLAAYKIGESLAWGYYRHCDVLAPLGSSRLSLNPVVDLFIAKFIGQTHPTLWSGYPADYRRNVQDRPPTSVLSEWADGGIIAKYEISRIRGGKKCNLSK
jgi:hypothetical protein